MIEKITREEVLKEINKGNGENVYKVDLGDLYLDHILKLSVEDAFKETEKTTYLLYKGRQKR